MKNIFLVLAGVLLTVNVMAAGSNYDKERLKKVWKIEQLYYDSIVGDIDTLMSNFRLIPAPDSVFILHDGISAKLFYWNLEGENQKISVYQQEHLIGNGTPPFLEYMIHYLDDQNLILTLDVSAWDLSIRQIEYRLIPDPDYF